MLRHDRNITEGAINPISAIIALANGNSPVPKVLSDGVYEIGHFGSSDWPPDYEHLPNGLEINSYGVCDDWLQIEALCPTLRDPSRIFIILLTPIRHADQPARGGWRWHKWGPYIGAHDYQHEYLYDEEGIEVVYCYHIYEKL